MEAKRSHLLQLEGSYIHKSPLLLSAPSFFTAPSIAHIITQRLFDAWIQAKRGDLICNKAS
jgi:hypothetical protein